MIPDGCCELYTDRRGPFHSSVPFNMDFIISIDAKNKTLDIKAVTHACNPSYLITER
jgi:hypothetical protein